MSTEHFLREHILRLQEELGKYTGITLLPNKEYLFDKNILDPLLALYDHKMKEQAHIIKIYEQEAKEIKKELVNHPHPSENDNIHDDMHILDLERKVEQLEDENEELSTHLEEAESTLNAAAEKLDIYSFGMTELTTKYKMCVDDFQKYKHDSTLKFDHQKREFNTVIQLKDQKIKELEFALERSENVVEHAKTTLLEMGKKLETNSKHDKVNDTAKSELILELRHLERENDILNNKVRELEQTIQTNSKSYEINRAQIIERHLELKNKLEEKCMQFELMLQETQLKLSQLIKNKDKDLIALEKTIDTLKSDKKELQKAVEENSKQPTQQDNYELIIHNLSQKLRESELNRARSEENYNEIKDNYNNCDSAFQIEKRNHLEQITVLENQLKKLELEKERREVSFKDLFNDFDDMRSSHEKLKMSSKNEITLLENELGNLQRKLTTLVAQYDFKIKELNDNYEATSKELKATTNAAYDTQQQLTTQLKNSSKQYESIISNFKSCIQQLSDKLETSLKVQMDYKHSKSEYQKELLECQSLYKESQHTIIALRLELRENNEKVTCHLKKLNHVMEERRQALCKVDQLNLKLSYLEVK